MDAICHMKMSKQNFGAKEHIRSAAEMWEKMIDIRMQEHIS